MGPVDQMMKNLSILYRQSQLEFSKALEPLGIGGGQYTYILVVCDQPGITQDCVTARLLYNKSSVARAIAQLETNGLLRRETDPADKRIYRLYPTEKGREARRFILRMVREHTDVLTAELEPEEREITAKALARMAERAKRGQLDKQKAMKQR